MSVHYKYKYNAYQKSDVKSTKGGLVGKMGGADDAQGGGGEIFAQQPYF